MVMYTQGNPEMPLGVVEVDAGNEYLVHAVNPYDFGVMLSFNDMGYLETLLDASEDVRKGLGKKDVLSFNPMSLSFTDPCQNKYVDKVRIISGPYAGLAVANFTRLYDQELFNYSLDAVERAHRLDFFWDDHVGERIKDKVLPELEHLDIREPNAFALRWLLGCKANRTHGLQVMDLFRSLFFEDFEAAAKQADVLQALQRENYELVRELTAT